MAFILYLDRICLGEIVKSASFKGDVPLSKEQIGKILGSFFFTYAIFQVPAGWASDRWGARRMMTGYIVLWSLFTGLTGFMSGFWGLLLARLGCGIAEAGAYPTSGALIRRWIPLAGRGQASALVALGGRMVTLVLAWGMVGQLVGGWTCDWSVRRFGLRWGRIFALGSPLLLGGGLYFFFAARRR